MFRDMVSADIDNVFLNSEEFAEVPNVNGSDVLAVVSNDMSKPNSRVPGGVKSTDGLHGDVCTVNVRKDTISRLPKQGENFKLDGKLYKVDTCTDDMGMLTICLRSYRMGGGVYA